MATREDLIRETAGELFGLASGQPVEADAAAFIEQRIDPTIAFLAATDVVYIATADEFDDALLNPLARYLADVCKPKFLQPRSPIDRQQAEDDLSLLQRINGEATTPTLRIDRALTPRRRVF